MDGDRSREETRMATKKNLPAAIPIYLTRTHNELILPGPHLTYHDHHRIMFLVWVIIRSYSIVLLVRISKNVSLSCVLPGVHLPSASWRFFNSLTFTWLDIMWWLCVWVSDMSPKQVKDTSKFLRVTTVVGKRMVVQHESLQSVSPFRSSFRRRSARPLPPHPLPCPAPWLLLWWTRTTHSPHFSSFDDHHQLTALDWTGRRRHTERISGLFNALIIILLRPPLSTSAAAAELRIFGP